MFFFFSESLASLELVISVTRFSHLFFRTFTLLLKPSALFFFLNKRQPCLYHGKSRKHFFMFPFGITIIFLSSVFGSLKEDVFFSKPNTSTLASQSSSNLSPATLLSVLSPCYLPFPKLLPLDLQTCPNSFQSVSELPFQTIFGLVTAICSSLLALSNFH